MKQRVIRNVNGVHVPATLRLGQRMQHGKRYLIVSQDGTCFTGTLTDVAKNGRGRTCIFRGVRGSK